MSPNFQSIANLSLAEIEEFVKDVSDPEIHANSRLLALNRETRKTEQTNTLNIQRQGSAGPIRIEFEDNGQITVLAPQPQHPDTWHQVELTPEQKNLLHQYRQAIEGQE